MRVVRQFEKSDRAASRQTAQIQIMIEDLRRRVILLDTDIEAIEAYERQVDPTNAAYPIAARTIKARRNNLIRTISLLEAKLSTLRNVGIELTPPIREFSSELSDLRDES